MNLEMENCKKVHPIGYMYFHPYKTWTDEKKREHEEHTEMSEESWSEKSENHIYNHILSRFIDKVGK